MNQKTPESRSERVVSTDTLDGAFHYDDNPMFDRIWLACGFRPFFLLSALYGAVSVLAWGAFWSGALELPATIPTVQWHAHEMIFGFMSAAICGFLLTAVPEWTDTKPVTGRWLALLVGVWLVGRLSMWLAGLLPMVIVGILNLALLPMLAAWTIPQLLADTTKRHRSFSLLITALWLAQFVTYLGWLGVLDGFDWSDDISMRALNAGLHVFLIAIVLTLTRISMVLVPLALKEQGDIESKFRPLPPRRNLASATLILFAFADFIAPNNAVTGWIALAAASAQLDRMADWHVGRVLLKPYILMIYVANGWMALGLAGLGFHALFDWDVFASSRHALGLGAASTAIMAVLLIAGLRHTGRDVVILKLSLIALVLISLATALRVGVPIVFPGSFHSIGVGVASMVWALAFAMYLVSFSRFLLEPRIDGLPG